MTSFSVSPNSDLAKVLEESHQSAIIIAEGNKILIESTDGCINLSLYSDPIVRKHTEVVVVHATNETLWNRGLHISEGSTSAKNLVCRCYSTRSLPRPVNDTDILVQQHFNLSHVYPYILSISKNPRQPHCYYVVVDFTNQLHPRMLPLTNLAVALDQSEKIADAIETNYGLGLYSIASPTASTFESDEFQFICSEPLITNLFTSSAEWIFVPEKSSSLYTFHESIQQQNLRRMTVRAHEKWHCVVQFTTTRPAVDLATDFEAIEKAVRPRFKKELLLEKSTCELLLSQALGQQRILSLISVHALESSLIKQLNRDKLFVVAGCWLNKSLDDSGVWKNSNSKLQSPSGTGDKTATETRVTTYVLREKDVVNVSTVLKKEHVLFKGYTFVYYYKDTIKRHNHETKMLAS